MPGAFAHISAVNKASANTALAKLNVPQHVKKTLSQYQAFLEFGCVSPDYPYLAIGNHAQNKWADEMHYNEVGKLIATLIDLIKQLDDHNQKKAFAWLCGFVAHVAADITIHPVVELKVGPYTENAKDHRICEMHQDTYIWHKVMNLGNIGLADRVKENIGSCVDEHNDDSIDLIIYDVWQTALVAVYPHYAEECPPDINRWHHGFQTVVNHAEESHKLFAWARHVASAQGLTYPLPEEVNSEFVEGLQTPHGIQHYDEIFDRAVSTIQIFWEKTAEAVFENGATDFFKNWNLDTGFCEDGVLTAWETR
ncbi:zinc dependent phospholipase C family protein [Photobacterium sp. TLY01]|uniref:zinc dependent phospholipase C family protein n=1 Tax=Photobacterium sp. TLY01 TaxID=2907534 RepID=UPI001F27C09B|nr:zinc dependent phospholipase C family protein [Photobacterium sp. TLY01]UIP29762.1 zinc dependent phospholipase C family protein [Photobacterium sp. TLY01]